MKVSFGLSSVHYAPYTPGAGGALGTWAAPVWIPGAVTFTPSAQGNSYTFYADNGNYFSYTTDTGDAGDLEMAYFPDEFLMAVLGWEKDANGVLLELSGKAQKPFALLFEVQGVDADGSDNPIRIVYYNVTGSKPSTEYATTEEGVEVKTTTMGITCAPLNFPNFGAMAKARVVKSDGAPYASFFSAVYEPELPEAD
jgi:phi13 family phage major tail protein